MIIAFVAGVLVGVVVTAVGLSVMALRSIEDTEPNGYDGQAVSVTRFRHEAGQLQADRDRVLSIRDGKPTTAQAVQAMRERGAA